MVVNNFTSQHEGFWFEPQLGPFCLEFALLPVLVLVFAFLPQTKNMDVRLIGDCKWTVSKNASVQD